MSFFTVSFSRFAPSRVLEGTRVSVFKTRVSAHLSTGTARTVPPPTPPPPPITEPNQAHPVMGSIRRPGRGCLQKLV